EAAHAALKKYLQCLQLEELANTSPVVLEDLVISKSRGRPVDARNKNKRMMQRELSEFEH
ncbi:17301_t:CDS:2, partial [Dentiscutata heterogama]